MTLASSLFLMIQASSILSLPVVFYSHADCRSHRVLAEKHWQQELSVSMTEQEESWEKECLGKLQDICGRNLRPNFTSKSIISFVEKITGSGGRWRRDALDLFQVRLRRWLFFNWREQYVIEAINNGCSICELVRLLFKDDRPLSLTDTEKQNNQCLHSENCFLSLQ